MYDAVEEIQNGRKWDMTVEEIARNLYANGYTADRLQVLFQDNWLLEMFAKSKSVTNMVLIDMRQYFTSMKSNETGSNAIGNGTYVFCVLFLNSALLVVIFYNNIM